jgi:hypothetical protein
MKIPGLGEVTNDVVPEWYASAPMTLPLLNGKAVPIVVDGYDDDPAPEEFHTAIQNLLICPNSVLRSADEHIYQYYKDMNADFDPSDEAYVQIDSPDQVWDHITLAPEVYLRRRGYGDKALYAFMTCECDWEPEHALMIVLKNAQTVCKIGPYDDHMTTSDAYGDNSLEDVIYRSIF